MAVTFVNHSTFLIQTAKHNILTDPVWSKRVSPLTWVGPKRAREPGLEFEKIPKLDVILISHNHYDHMDVATLQKLSKKFNPLVVVPLGDKYIMERHGITNVIEMDWWESTTFNDLKITFTPAQHFSSRGLFDRNRSLWGSYLINASGKMLYFGGDTGYSPHFSEINSRFGAPDLALLPIGAYEPNWFMKPVHINPAEAVQAHLDLKAKKSIGMHLGTFQLTEEAIDQPKIELNKALKDSNLSENDFVVLGEGQTAIYNLK